MSGSDGNQNKPDGEKEQQMRYGKEYAILPGGGAGLSHRFLLLFLIQFCRLKLLNNLKNCAQNGTNISIKWPTATKKRCYY